MKNPFGSEPESGSYVDLKKRMLQRLQSLKVNDQIFEVVQVAYEDALKEEKIVLSDPERKRMLSQILKTVLEDMLKKLDGRSRGVNSET
jgi:predicted TIM-barrel fold metal-dependent hydrolase